LALVVLAPSVLRLVPTASLAAVLVYTGYKLVSPSHLRELRDFGWGAVSIYAATLAGVVFTDLLRGVLLGLGLSLLRLLWKLGSFEIDVREHDDGSRIDVYMRGAATFLGLPRLARILERLPHAAETHLHIDELSFIDHACLVALGDYERLRGKLGAEVIIDWANLDARSERVGGVGELQPS
jgi:MFS superfamily sulfate permease-like transporter